MSGHLELKIGLSGRPYTLTHWEGDVFSVSPSSENQTDGSLSSVTFKHAGKEPARELTIEYLDGNGLGLFGATLNAWWRLSAAILPSPTVTPWWTGATSRGPPLSLGEAGCARTNLSHNLNGDRRECCVSEGRRRTTRPQLRLSIRLCRLYCSWHLSWSNLEHARLQKVPLGQS